MDFLKYHTNLKCWKETILNCVATNLFEGNDECWPHIWSNISLEERELISRDLPVHFSW